MQVDTKRWTACAGAASVAGESYALVGGVTVCEDISERQGPYLNVPSMLGDRTNNIQGNKVQITY